jgi:hypothetical protein
MFTTPAPRLAARLRTVRHNDDGMTTAEYAVGTVAACGFGGILYKVITSDPVTELLSSLVEKALTWIF